jgi:toxin-antitoxin system, antitoxin component, xre family|nr:MAG TPA: helix-turn-helix domain protein [Caudoviricetes sp.]
MKFSDNLRILRAEYRLTQQDIGDIVGLTAQAVSKWENNLAEPDNESLKKLAKHFNVSVDYLLGIKEEKETNALDNLLFNKAKELSDDDKKAILGVINAIKKDVDKDLDK